MVKVDLSATEDAARFGAINVKASANFVNLSANSVNLSAMFYQVSAMFIKFEFAANMIRAREK